MDTSDYAYLEKKCINVDIEQVASHDNPFDNVHVKSFSWRNINVSVTDRLSKEPKAILSNKSGVLYAGELLAVMGPSGCGKTTLLDYLANRLLDSGLVADGKTYVNGNDISSSLSNHISCYVEQEDALIGSLTVKETLSYAAKLSLPSSLGKNERASRVEELVNAFGLAGQDDTLIGTPIRRGLSGGQKRRVGIATQLITGAKIVFLDEPTSGLDSVASLEVMSYIKNIAKRHRLVVIASIHQPSSATFNLFDKLLLLSRGHTIYNGPVLNIRPYFEQCGSVPSLYTNPAEFLLNLVNTDFADDIDTANDTLRKLTTRYLAMASTLTVERANRIAPEHTIMALREEHFAGPNRYLLPLTLIHRSFVKSYRDIIVYGIRVVMYVGLAIIMGTVWLRLVPEGDGIQAYGNAIFFGGAFMSFMAVAYVPAYLEDRALYIKERQNGLYGPTSFMVANFVTGIPYLFIISICFSVIAYWLSNFQPTATAFFTYVMWLFLALIAAESLVVLCTSLIPNFVIALVAVAFVNGLFMCVNGFVVRTESLNVFWRYVFHYIDYQTYYLEGMMVNEFSNRIYDCVKTPDGCFCQYQSRLADQCQIDGKAVLESYGYGSSNLSRSVGIMLVIICAYRLAGWMVLYFKRT